MVIIGIILALFAHKAAVTVALLTLGAGCFALAELLPRLSGPIELGPGGLKAQIQKAETTVKAITKESESTPDLFLPTMEVQSPSENIHFKFGDSQPLTLTEDFSLLVEYTVTLESGESFNVQMPIEFIKDNQGDV